MRRGGETDCEGGKAGEMEEDRSKGKVGKEGKGGRERGDKATWEMRRIPSSYILLGEAVAVTMEGVRGDEGRRVTREGKKEGEKGI